MVGTYIINNTHTTFVGGGSQLLRISDASQRALGTLAVKRGLSDISHVSFARPREWEGWLSVIYTPLSVNDRR